MFRNSNESPPLRHRELLAICLAVLGIGAVGFYGGATWMKYDADIRTAKAMQVASAADQARNLYVMRIAIQELRAGRALEGETMLLRYAKLHVNAVAECRKSPECIFWAGRNIPSQDELSELATMKERQ